MILTVKPVSPYRGLMFRCKPKAPISFPSKVTNSLHTWFVFYRIDVIFLNREGRVIGTISRMRPFSYHSIPRNTVTIIESTALPFKIGDNIELEVAGIDIKELPTKAKVRE